jgi:hypothetical protein
MPALVYFGIQYSRKASDYFARTKKAASIGAAPADDRNIIVKEKKPQKMGLSQGDIKVKGRADRA